MKGKSGMTSKSDRRAKAVQMVHKTGNAMPENFNPGKGAPGYARGGRTSKGHKTQVNVNVINSKPQGPDPQMVAQQAGKAGLMKGIALGHAAAQAGAGAPPMGPGGPPPMSPNPSIGPGGPPTGAGMGAPPPGMPPRPGLKRGGIVKSAMKEKMSTKPEMAQMNVGTMKKMPGMKVSTKPVMKEKMATKPEMADMKVKSKQKMD